MAKQTSTVPRGLDLDFLEYEMCGLMFFGKPPESIVWNAQVKAYCIAAAVKKITDIELLPLYLTHEYILVRTAAKERMLELQMGPIRRIFHEVAKILRAMKPSSLEDHEFPL